jgi:hypothetical protein
MEIHHHKVKPIKNWRELAKEVGIIVLGVVIALGGEQAVEAIHHGGEVRELRRALDQELAWDLKSLQDTVDQTPCVMRRLDELDRWRKSFTSGHPLKLSAAIQEPSYPVFRTAAWRSVSGSTVDLMPLDKRIAYAQFYDGVDNNTRLRARNDEAWDALSEFEEAPLADLSRTDEDRP